MLRQVLLALLSRERTAHGYGLMKSYQERMGVPLRIGSVYRELQHLVADGLIVTSANPPGTDPRRTTYTLTERGHEALAAWLAGPVDGPGRNVNEEVAYRLAIVGELDVEVAGRALRTLYDRLWELAKRVETERAASDRDGGRAGVVRQTLLARRSMQLAADIEIVRNLMQTVGEQRPSLEAPADMAAGRPRRVATRARQSAQGRSDK